MCSITSKLYFNPVCLVDESLIGQMNTVLVHRGPDDGGVWTDGPIGLGQRRLAIIDLSPTGHQPMSNEDGTIWIAFNGEIYNHLELRADLERRGHHYRSTSDAETVLHLYEEHGRDCMTYLRGMFAFALWDGRQRHLLLARDRFGRKPLLYAETADGLTFAFEIQSILLKTFSIGFDDQSFNELPYARRVAERYATDHLEFIVTPEALAVLPELVWAYGEPYADSSALPTYYVARETRRHVTVALNGDGGDEAFAGYERYLATRLAARYEQAPRWLREGIITPLECQSRCLTLSQS